jgi:hypothetical protein
LTGQVWVTVIATGLGAARSIRQESFVAALTGPEDDLEPPSFLRSS